MHTFSVFFLFVSLNLFCYVFVLFGFFSLNFQADTNSILFHLVVENLILHIFIIIMIIMPCSGMFRNAPCSWFYRRPKFDSVLKSSTWADRLTFWPYTQRRWPWNVCLWASIRLNNCFKPPDISHSNLKTVSSRKRAS